MPRHRAQDPFASKRVGRRPGPGATPPVETPGEVARSMAAALRARLGDDASGALTVFSDVDDHHGEPWGEAALEGYETIGELHIGEAIGEPRIAVAGDTLVQPAHQLEVDAIPAGDEDFTVRAGDLPPEAAIGDAVVVTGPPDGEGNVLGALAHVAGFGSDGTATLRWGVAPGQEPQEGPQLAEGTVGPGGAAEAESDDPAPLGDALASWPGAVEAAVVLGVDPAEVRRRCREGELDAAKDGGGAWRINPAALAAP